ncbi:MAG: LicD family protein [Eubacteriales bacterium]|nr:LicD family protein [Eubacteriales bacterium]
MKFDKSFFQTEIRCDFEISEMMKRAWAAELEVYEVLQTICDKHSLKLFADGGTLLGAVRHKGFIPWDDDMDFCLLREDYNRLIELLPNELPAGFVMTGMYATTKRLQDAGDVHHLRVIADEEYWDMNSYMKRFHGFPYYRIGVDIFPVDYYLDNDDEIERRDMLLKIWNILTVYNRQSNVYSKTLREIEAFFDITLPRDASLRNILWRMYDSLCMMFSKDECPKVIQHTYALDNSSKAINKDCYDHVEYMEFEHIKMPVPNGYKEVLTAEYDDYMTFSKGTAIHTYPFYKEQEQGLKEIMLKKGLKHSIEEMCRLYD